MKIIVDISAYLPGWNSKIVKKIWYFRDYLVFQFGGHDAFPTPNAQSDNRLTLDFKSADEAKSVLQALNQAGKGIVASAA